MVLNGLFLSRSKILSDDVAEIVQSLAKWKRLALADLQIKEGFGIYTDMNAIRPDETSTICIRFMLMSRMGTCHRAKREIAILIF